MPALLQNKARLQSLDSFRLHTRGTPLNAHNLLAIFNPSSTVKTLILERDGKRSFIQVRVEDGKARAQLDYLIPKNEGESLEPELLEGAIKTAGSWGVQVLLADLPAESLSQPLFKRLGFIHWARQKVYRVSRRRSSGQPLTFPWRTWTNADMPMLEAVYRSLVPGLFQPIEQLTRKAKLGLILQDTKGKCLGFVDYDEGLKGIWLQPFLLPELNGEQVFQDALACLHVLGMGPIFISARSYQPWVEAMLQGSDSNLISEQNLLVKYIATPIPATETQQSFTMEKSRIESTFPT